MLAEALRPARSAHPGFDEKTLREFAVVETIEAALFRIGRPHGSFRWSELHIDAGQHVALPQDADHRLPDGVLTIETTDIAEYKRWVGFDDDAIRNGTAQAVDVDRARLVGPDALDVDELTPELARAVETAATAYLFGDSREVAGYAAVLNRHYAPYRAQVIVASRIVLDAGAQLRIDGLPTVVIAEEMVFNGGRLFVSPVGHFSIGLVTGRQAVSKEA